MSIITLGQLQTLWQNVSDWVTGANNTYKPAVKRDVVIPSQIVVMQNAITAPASGNALPTAGYGKAVLDIAGTATSFTIQFMGQGPGGNWQPASAENRSTGIISTTATSPGIYDIRCDGLQNIMANVTAISGGNLTVTGQAVPYSPGQKSIQLTGRNAQIITVVNALAIADTNLHTYSIDASAYKSIRLFAVTTLNQSVTVKLQANPLVYTYNGSAWGVVTVTLPANDLGFLYDLNSYLPSSYTDYNFPIISTNNVFKVGLQVVLICNTAPTSGSVSIYLKGVPN